MGSFAAAWTGLTLVLGLLPGRAQIAPRIQSDYCYQLLAADRLYEGLGLTSLQPVAPLQPWDWQFDWGYLTQWPPGFALLICGVRAFFGFTTITACQWISAGACAAALLGWFLWVKRIVPPGAAGLLLAAVAAGCALPIEFLVEPSTDVLLVALLPFVLLLAPGNKDGGAGSGEKPQRASTIQLCFLGLAVGGLVWVRYAAIFVAPAIGCYLLTRWWLCRSVRFRQIMLFGVCALAPMLALMAMNRAWGAGSAQQQFNVGHSVSFHLTPGLVIAAWENFTDLGFYDYHWYSRWLFLLWPPVLVAAGLSSGRMRLGFRRFLGYPAVCLSAFVLFSALAMLIAATTLFGDKFDYVALMRYYRPIRPLYFALFAAPFLLIRHRFVRVGAFCVALVACSWIVQQEWRKPYTELVSEQRASTPYGRLEEAFPGRSSRLYLWLAEQAAPELVLISNFHEYVSLETRIPAFPIPKDLDALHRWIADIRSARGVEDLRVLFLLDPDNRWRGYWQPDPIQTAHRFDLRPCGAVPEGIADLVFEYQPCREDQRPGQREGGAISTAPVRKRPFPMSGRNDATPSVARISRGLKPVAWVVKYDLWKKAP